VHIDRDVAPKGCSRHGRISSSGHLSLIHARQRTGLLLDGFAGHVHLQNSASTGRDPCLLTIASTAQHQDVNRVNHNFDQRRLAPCHRGCGDDGVQVTPTLPHQSRP
jgi:hypothetical protein